MNHPAYKVAQDAAYERHAQKPDSNPIEYALTVVRALDNAGLLIDPRGV